jgi:predicted dienelactone hydrolase
VISPSGSRRAVAALAIALVAIATGCSSSEPKSTSETTTTTTTAPPSPAPYAKAGPYSVGFTTVRFAQRRAVVWYPVQHGEEEGHAPEVFDIASLLSPELQAKIPAGKRPRYTANAFADAPAAAESGGYPLVIFSHGFAGYPEQSVSLTTHLASWGFVVAAPDHVERSLDGLLGTAARGVAPMSDLALLQATTDRLITASKDPGILHGVVNSEQIVAAGHSAGAGAAYEFASSDPRVKAWISYSVGFDRSEGPPPAAPTKPGMVMLGTTDGILPAAASRNVFTAMRAPKYLVEFEGAGHLVFSDICLIGREQGGVTGIARAIKLPIPESLLKLGSDGCESSHPPVEKAFPAIDHLSVAFFRWALHIDPKPVGLATDAVSGLGAKVIVRG